MKVMIPNRKIIFLASIAGVLVAPGLVTAQTQAAPSSPATQRTTATSPAPTAGNAGVNISGQAVPASDLQREQAQALAAGDNTLVTNGPVPDTPQNRARLGAPLSHAGRATAPAGN